jgi:hypothetical protein
MHARACPGLDAFVNTMGSFIYECEKLLLNMDRRLQEKHFIPNYAASIHRRDCVPSFVSSKSLSPVPVVCGLRLLVFVCAGFLRVRDSRSIVRASGLVPRAPGYIFVFLCFDFLSSFRVVQCTRPYVEFIPKPGCQARGSALLVHCAGSGRGSGRG